MNFKNQFLSFALSFISFLATAQIQEISAPLWHSPTVPSAVPESGDTLVPPFVDDFSYPSDRPSPTLWQDQKVLINDGYALYPNSIGVATFDGLNEFGFAYKPGSFNSDSLADVLTSAYLDLSGLNNVWLSFQYQSAGTGEAPSVGDSLVVEYWSPVTQSWTFQWGVRGDGNATGFSSVIIPVTGSDYLRDGFAFRIGAYGARSGAFDIWNVDYVQLDKDRNAADTIITEPAFARAHPLIIGSGPFTSWPWWVSNASSVANRPSTLQFTYRRNGVVPSGGWSLNLGQFRWEENGTLIQQTTAVPVITNTNHNVDQTFTMNVPAAALGILSGPTVVKTKVWFDGSAAGFRSNDTVRGTLELDNYLALDDGTAERAYAVQNINGGRVAQRFQTSGLGLADSLKGVRINFVDAGERYASTFRLAVWGPSDSVGAPGELLYMSDSLYEPDWGYYRGDMIPYELDSTLDISSYAHVWIGYVCTTADPMFVGLDTERTLPGSMPRYYGDGFNWYPSLESGVMLLQPYFRYSPADMNITQFQPRPTFLHIYPNPSEGQLLIQSTGKTIVVIMDAQGRKVFEAEVEGEAELGLEYLPAGLYTISGVQGDEINHLKWVKL